MATVFVPTALRRFTAGQSKVEATGATVGDVIGQLESSYPGIGERLLDDNGNVKRFINVFRNDDEIRTLDGLATTVGEGDKISIVPAMAGGSG
jgi:molybdopterin converting factor small subunit